MSGGISILSTLKNKTIIYLWRHRPLMTYLFWTFLSCCFSVKDGFFLSLLSLMIHLRVSDMWLLCRASCCLKESNFLDKYCHYAVIYPFAIRAYSLISSFMICLPKRLHCAVHVLENQIKYPCSHSASLFHTQLSSLYKSLPYIVPELLDKQLIKKPETHGSLCALHFFPFSQKYTVATSNSILPKAVLDGMGNKIMIAQSGVSPCLFLLVCCSKQCTHSLGKRKVSDGNCIFNSWVTHWKSS